MTQSTLLPIIPVPFSETFASVSPPLIDWLSRAKVKKFLPPPQPAPQEVRKPTNVAEYLPTPSEIWMGCLDVQLGRLEREMLHPSPRISYQTKKRQTCDQCDTVLKPDGVYAVRPVRKEKGGRALLCYSCARHRLIETYENRARIDSHKTVKGVALESC